MTWIGIAVILIGLYIAFKLVGVVFKILAWSVIIITAYWLVAPHLGWPTPWEIIDTLFL